MALFYVAAIYICSLIFITIIIFMYICTLAFWPISLASGSKKATKWADSSCFSPRQTRT